MPNTNITGMRLVQDGQKSQVLNLSNARRKTYAQLENMSAAQKKGVIICEDYPDGGAAEAEDIAYDNTTSQMTATDVQGAIDELNAGIVNAGTVRYNENTDRLEVLLNGSWVQSIRAFVQSIAVWVSGLFGVSVSNGVYDTTTGHTVRAFTESGNNLVANYQANTNRFTLITDNVIDFTNYDYVKVKCSIGDGELNVSGISGSYYLAIAADLNSSSNYCNYDIILSNTKTAFFDVSNRVAFKEVPVSFVNSISISEITIE